MLSRADQYTGKKNTLFPTNHQAGYDTSQNVLFPGHNHHANQWY